MTQQKQEQLAIYLAPLTIWWSHIDQWHWVIVSEGLAQGPYTA